MKSILVVALTSLLLSGCLSMPSLPQQTPAATYYTLDARSLKLCRGDGRSRCYSLSNVASARTLLRPVEEVYGQQVKGPNYPLNFARMLINPPDQSYQSESDDGRIYRLPINAHTDAAWRAMENIYASYYNRS
ncbi:hypothetical protein [Nitrincola tapanii]|uniref:Lipoprotein n=1 Tax=Nitrincola tapanii TaxID=1708751 RepID=A0A5A9W2C1_9GAMM|nr:hypothetical protein [Nitrincola tapanii]KAA0874654.1 hypothetical protein E1H14_07435 [Nitrincola tapanii]